MRSEFIQKKICIISRALLFIGMILFQQSVLNAQDESPMHLKPTMPSKPFQPITLTDDQGRPLDSNTSIKLNDGRTTTLDVLLKELNELERYLSERGHSTREGSQNLGVIDELPLDYTKIESQGKAILDDQVKASNANISVEFTPDDLRNKSGSVDAVPSLLGLYSASSSSKEASNPLNGRQPLAVRNYSSVNSASGKENESSTTKTYKLAKGDDKFNFSLDFSYETSGKKAVFVSANGKAVGSATIIKAFSVLDAAVIYQSPTTGEAQARLDMTVLGGKKVFHENFIPSREPFSSIKDGKEQYVVTLENTVAKIPVPIAAYVIHVSFGAKYVGGLTWGASIAPMNIKASIANIHELLAFVAAAVFDVNLGIVKGAAGVRGELVLIRASLGADGKVALGFDEVQGAFLETAIAAKVNASMFDGEIFLFLHLQHPSVKWIKKPPFVETYWATTTSESRLASFKGINLLDSVLFSMESKYWFANALLEEKNFVLPSIPEAGVLEKKIAGIEAEFSALFAKDFAEKSAKKIDLDSHKVLDSANAIDDQISKLTASVVSWN